MKRVMDFFLHIYAFPMNILLRRISSEKGLVLKKRYIEKLYTGDEYVLLRSFPKCVNNISVKGTRRNFSNTAIILQGPIATKDDFTLNTIKMYKKYYDGIRIIVSTWKDTDDKIVKEMESEDAYVILNDYPAVNPKGNLNCQLVTSLAGVLEARKLGVKYVAKTRTDQRYYNPCALSLLQGVYQEGKIVLLGGVLNSFYARPFYISDFFAFGNVDELEVLYSCEFDTTDAVKMRENAKQKEEFIQFNEWVKMADIDCRINIPQEFEDSVIKYACPETRIAYNFYTQKNGTAENINSAEAYNIFLCNNAIVVDADSLGFYWLKYEYQFYSPSYFRRLGKFDEAKWYELRQERHEHYLNRCS